MILSLLLLPLSYNPLSVPELAKVRATDLTIRGSARSREIPVRIYELPATKTGPVLLFSHGLGGNRYGSEFLGRHWAALGYLAVFLQHPGSDESVWKDVKPAARMGAMQRAASLDNFLLRVEDVPAVLDQLALWNNARGHLLTGKLDLKRVGMSGHSFGAVTTQGTSGQSYPVVGTKYTDPRIKAAVIMSPSSAGPMADKRAFGSVALPWLLMTGTNDNAPIGNQSPESRRRVFPALPKGDKYELVLDKAEHSVFTERALPGDRLPRNPNHHKVILALTTAFWDAYLKKDHAAKAWLKGAEAKKMLDTKDVWQWK